MIFKVLSNPKRSMVKCRDDKRKRRNTLPFFSALKIFAINVDSFAMNLNLFYDIVFLKHILIYFLHINSTCLSSRISVVKGITTKAQGTCYVLPRPPNVHSNLKCQSQ